MSASAAASARERLFSAAGQALSGLVWRLKRALGLRRSVRAGGARYVERGPEPLHRALSRHGAGVKEYTVEFSDGSRMRIGCTRERVYADLARPARLDVLEAAERAVIPGMRVLVLEGGTGWAGERLSRLVGPSGAVVSLDRDEESVKFAQRRYRLKNAAFEVGHVESLKGETDGAFDAVIAIEEDVEAAGECWRVVRPGGVMVVAGAALAHQDESPDDDVAVPDGGHAEVLTDGSGPWRVIAVHKPAG